MSEGVYRLLSRLIEDSADKLVDLCVQHGEESTAEFLKHLENAPAAKLLQHLPPWFGAMAIARLDNTLIVKLLEVTDTSTAARSLRAIEPLRRQQILDGLEPKIAKKVASFVTVDESRTGSVVRSGVLTAIRSESVSNVLNLIRKYPDQVQDYLYLVTQENELVGVLPMKRLLLAESTQSIDSLATLNPDKLTIDDPLVQSATHPRWRKAKVMPVVDKQNHFVGVVAKADLPTSSVSETALQDASQALAESFGVGLFGLLRLLSTGSGKQQ